MTTRADRRACREEYARVVASLRAGERMVTVVTKSSVSPTYHGTQNTVLNLLEREGFLVEGTKGRHINLQGGAVVVIGRTNSDVRNGAQTLQALTVSEQKRQRQFILAKTHVCTGCLTRDVKRDMCKWCLVFRGEECPMRRLRDDEKLQLSNVRKARIQGQGVADTEREGVGSDEVYLLHTGSADVRDEGVDTDQTPLDGPSKGMP